ncbi:MAG: M20/M25/M40 family metallo-hydrolase [Desulfobacteraceae bacterium]|nr:M20/M25/M40 family metallo-hydrolase [Desulfobacteraceae bacterium]
MTDYEKFASQIIEEAINIQQIAAPTFSEKKRSEHVFKLFCEKGLENVFTDELHNVYGRIPGGDAHPVVLTAHLDTVFDESTDLAITRENTRIHGPGIGDNSLGVATLVGLKDVVDTFAEKPAGDIILVANTCEEGLGDLAGIKQVLKTLSHECPKAYIVLEGHKLGRIYVKGVGSKRYKITAVSKGGHSWIDFGEGSAVHALVRLGAELTDLKVPLDPKTTFNIGVIQGGRSINTIADNAFLLLDLRSIDPFALENLVNQAETMIKAFNTEKATISYEIIGTRPAGEISKDSDLIRLCQKVHKSHGFDLNLSAGSTDANILFSKGIPAVCLGLTRGKNSHLESEYIETQPFAKGLSVVAHILEEIWSIP